MTKPTETLPVNLTEYEEAARRILPPASFGHVAGAAGDEATLRANREAFGGWRLLPRVLRGAASPNLRTTVLGEETAMPVLLAPTGTHKLMHPEGEVATARAARRAGLVLVSSMTASCTVEETAAVGTPFWFQVLFLRERAMTLAVLRRAEAAGAKAIVITLDMPVVGRRETDERNQFAMPPGITFANFNVQQAATAGGSGFRAHGDSVLFAGATWDDLRWLCENAKVPVIAKGILAPEDAVLAIEHGAKAIIVSNHGGRQLDGAVGSLDALPAVVERVAGRAEVLMDGGIRRGTDVLKALSLGARAVLLGRPYLWGLAVGGEDGAFRVLDLLRKELEDAATLCGVRDVGEVSRELVVRAPSRT